ncbi:hypothetical protein ACTXN7_09825 [Corynebacterium flavescens]|uniref:hypothetical protein n=1 Tax=Corynebacterium flavescens TaxID=28028 RepID=UPI003FD048D2
MESPKNTTEPCAAEVAHVVHGVLTGSYRYTTLTDATELLRRGQLQGAAVVGGASLLLGGGIWLGQKLVNRSKSKTSSIENVEVDGKNPSSESVVPSANNEAEDADKEAVNDRVAKD